MPQYVIDKNPPPITNAKKIGRTKTDLRLALEAMNPGEGMAVVERSTKAISSLLAGVKRTTMQEFVVRSRDAGCYVWCVATAAKA